MAYGDVSVVSMMPELTNSIDDDSGSSPWTSLPTDIVEHALALLPFPYIFQVRSICKKWNSLIFCSQFQEASLRCPVPWGQFYSPRIGWKGGASPLVTWQSYNLSEGKWVSMPQFEFPTFARKFSWNLIAANGGLFCFGASDARRLLVCNPMTKRWKELLPVSLDSKAPIISHMIVDEQRNSYDILFLGNAAYKQPDARCRMVDLYDSVTDTWNAAEMLPADLILKSGAYCSGEFYCLTRHFLTGRYTIVILDLTMLRWRDNNIRIPEGFENYPYIVACSGQVHLVSGSSEATDTMPMASIGIFRLDPNLSSWEKVSEYSNFQFLRSTGAIYGCGAHGSKIYVVTYAYDMWIAVYNISTGIWEEPIKGNFYDMKDIFETKFSFQPNLRVAP
ncbi:F-box/kelch-repeat protein At5g15710 isoform X2 [Physcomitrium patens]|uniref:F-box domain-containing protein n=1 Tax=Physcomitrium patens TaxID=3218 RepID=A9SNV2_PHYPA|nr:F-box/kelch-repeat protein At5g15710-like isoform X2 [Physcomitrium patens]XP_024396524.1 F-box/kelch-repeat protein At5g15710-like isoform X2 [Physcomitrium patens]XP_024396525.1 F-box/kelch-repeat protein At5g15710-like isoform X2 [Physcomitrium patens]PNR39332.1 hypothetical protein PHYPA_019610 [Physcomitrium patens]|eukprot:XP_024396523.1 F-box/kelch-repeat protein At5g15710-like isoform X2 [Physcomitrella patens]